MLGTTFAPNTINTNKLPTRTSKLLLDHLSRGLGARMCLLSLLISPLLLDNPIRFVSTIRALAPPSLLLLIFE